MKNLIALSAVAAGLAAAPAAFAVQPTALPDTGTLTKAPAGSTVTIASKDQFGTKYMNYYSVNEDGSLEFVFQEGIGD